MKTTWVWGKEANFPTTLKTLSEEVTQQQKGVQLRHTSPPAFPDFNKHDFPVSVINPRVAVVHSTGTHSETPSHLCWTQSEVNVVGVG